MIGEVGLWAKENDRGMVGAAARPAPPSPYPLPLRFAGGEEIARRCHSLLSPAQRAGEGRERAARRRGGLNFSPSIPLAAASPQNRQADAVAVCEDIRVPEAQNAEPGALHVSGAAFVVGELIGVLATIDLDDKSSLDAEEIQEVRPPRDLALPPPASEAMGAQAIPKTGFGLRVVATEVARSIHGGDAPEGAYGSHRSDENICGTQVQASMTAPPSPYPLPLRFAGGEECWI